MERYFNTAGPVRQEMHYCIDPLSRIDLDGILSLIRQQKYFVLHAPRQTGKTSYLHALMEHLNRDGQYAALYTNLEMAQAARGDINKGMEAVLRAIADDAEDYLQDSFLKDNWKQILNDSGAISAFHVALKEWSKHSTKPLVLFLDEVDALVGDTLISLLRQLRAGYPKRPQLFPQSIILCGVRDVRDYRIHSDIEQSIITGGSAFNVKAKSLRLGNFSLREIEELFQQHTEATGQPFEPDVCPLVWEITDGQPWLVNAIGYEACFEIKEGQQRNHTITAGMIDQSKENIILRRDTHLDQLTDKLKEERVRRVLLPILAGSKEAKKIPEDDIDYVVDLGLIKKKPRFMIANRIYQEIVPRQLTYSTQLTINQEAAWYTDSDGRLDMTKLLTTFQDFFRKHFDSWVDGFDYAEAGPQLLLQAFLQRVINGGGRVDREYGLGRQRTDLLVTWPYKNGKQEVVLELKIRYGSLETTIQEGLQQIYGYMDKCGTKEGYLLIFDRSENKPWEEKIFQQESTIHNLDIKIFGM